MPRSSTDRDPQLAPPRCGRRRIPKRLRRRWPKPRLTVAQILEWADAFRRQKDRWPHHFDGRIQGAGEDTWSRVNDALMNGNRGLPGGSSLARLLYLHRGVRSPRNVPPLTERKIFAWARAHHRRNGQWPRDISGAVQDAPGETWAAIDLALARGTRGLPGGSSLAQLLDARGVKRNPQRRPRRTEKQILAAADAFFTTHGHWPYEDSGPIDELPGETWGAMDKALRRGTRGLPGGMSLASFLNKRRGIYGGRSRRRKRLREEERLRLEQIIAWGKAYRRRHGVFPNRDSGPISGSGGMKWSAVDSALKSGNRGLAEGSSLAKLFGNRREQRKRRQA